MLIKLGIIIGVVILGGIIFSNEIDYLFPNTSAVIVDSLKDDLTNFSTRASDSVENRITESTDQAVDNTVDKTNEFLTNEIDKTSDTIVTQISDNMSEVTDSSQKIIFEEISNFNLIKSVQDIFKNNFN